jgi:PKD repeat protein
MSIVAVHGPNTWGSTPGVETGPANAAPSQSNGLIWSFSADTSTRPAADYDWDFGANATPATQADSKGPVSVTYSVAGTKVVTLTVPNAVATISNKALTSNVVTLTTAAAHNLEVGDSVTVAMTVADPVLDGTYTVTSVPSGTTFTYAKTNANITSASAAGTATSAGHPAAGAYVMGIAAKAGPT